MTSVRRLLLIPAFLLLLPACGPALRYRPADTLPRGTVEVGGGVGAAARAEDGTFGGAEIQGWLRGGVHERVEVGGRFWTYTLSSFGGAFELRAALIKGPVDLTVDLGLIAGACCGAGDKNHTLAAAIGFDGGFSFGKRFGVRGPAFYIAPHFQYSRVLPVAQDWPMQLYLPVGADLPLGPGPVSIRPEFFAVALFHDNGVVRWRVGGGVGLALQGPGPKQLRERIAARKAAAEEEVDEEDEEAAMRRLYGLDRAPDPPEDDPED